MSKNSGAPLNAELLKAWKIIPDVVDEVGDPFLDVRVLYRDQVEVASGLAMRVAQTQGKPHVEMRGRPFGSSEDLYTFMMVDPDAPSPTNPTFRNFLHWLVINIPSQTPPTSGKVKFLALPMSPRLVDEHMVVSLDVVSFISFQILVILAMTSLGGTPLHHGFFFFQKI